MLLQLFKSKNPVLLGVIVLIIISLWIKTFLNSPSVLILDFKMPLFVFFHQLLSNNYLKLVIAIVFLILQVLFLVTFNNKYKVLQDNNFLHVFIFTLIINSFTELQNLYPIYIANLIFMLSFEKIVKSINTENAIPHYFEASFFISFASLFYFNIIFYILIVWIGLIIIRPIIWREWLVSLIGLALPYIFISSYYFIFENSNFQWITEIFNSIQFSFQQPHLSIIPLIVIGISSFISLLQFLKKKSLSITNRKIRILFMWIIIITFTLFLFTNNQSLQLVFIFTFASTFLITNYLTEIKRQWIGNLILYFLLGINIYQQFFAL